MVNFISIFLFFLPALSATEFPEWMHQRVDFQHFYVQSYPDSGSCHDAGDLIGGFSTLLLVEACNYCYSPPSSFKLLLSLSLSFFTINSYFRTQGMYRGSRPHSIFKIGPFLNLSVCKYEINNEKQRKLFHWKAEVECSEIFLSHLIFILILNEIKADAFLRWSPWKQSIFEPSVQTTSPEIPPLPNQGQLPHLDGGFLQTVTKASGRVCFFSAKTKHAEDSPPAIPVTHSLWPPAGLW